VKVLAIFEFYFLKKKCGKLRVTITGQNFRTSENRRRGAGLSKRQSKVPVWTKTLSNWKSVFDIFSMILDGNLLKKDMKS
jgi:hypothetical protein